MRNFSIKKRQFRYFTKSFGFLMLAFAIIACNKIGNEPEISDNTILVYMIADNNLSDFGYSNIQKMKTGYEASAKSGHLVVYFDPVNSSPVLLEFKNGKNGAVIDTIKKYPETNSSSVQMLNSVMQDVYSRFPSRKKGLILWGHGTGWMPDNTQSLIISGLNRKESLFPSWIRDPFKAETKAFGNDQKAWMNINDLQAAIPDNELDYIIFDACYMGGIETVYELKNKAPKIIASPTEILAEGFPYQKVVPILLSDNPDLKQVCLQYYQYYADQSEDEKAATVALINTSALDEMAEFIREKAPENPKVYADITGLQHFDRWNGRYYAFDLDQYYQRQLTSDDYNTFQTLLNNCIITRYNTPTFLPYYGGFTIDHFSGLSVYVRQPQYSSLNEAFEKTDWGRAISVQ